MLDISHIVYVRNHAATLDACLRSLLGHAGDYRCELWCINDNSTDASTAILEHYALSDARVKVLTSYADAGDAACINHAVDHCNATWLHITDGACVTPINACSQMLEELKHHHADVAMAACQPTDDAAETLVGRTMQSHPDIWLCDSPLQGLAKETVWHPYLIFRRDHFAAAGCCDAQLGMVQTLLPVRLSRVTQRWLMVQAVGCFATPESLLRTPATAHLHAANVLACTHALTFAAAPLQPMLAKRLLSSARAMCAALGIESLRADMRNASLRRLFFPRQPLCPSLVHQCQHIAASLLQK